MTHDYTQKGGIVHAEIMLSAYAPLEFADRSILWNSVEQIEKARDSQLAREIEAALPRELSGEQQLALVRAYVKDNFVDKGNVEIWRAAWAACTNRSLEAAGHPALVDHRSYKRQGIDKIPSVHLGPAASQMEKRGIRTDKGKVNRQIAADNKLLKEIKARITRLYRWSKDEAEKPQTQQKQLDCFVGGSAAVERSPHPHRQNPGFAGKRCTIQLFAGKRHPVYAAAS